MRSIKEQLRTWSEAIVEKVLRVRVYRDPGHGRDPYPAIRTLRTWAPGDVIFDVGSNDGRTVERLQPLFPSSTIYAFEPVSATFQKLVDQTRGHENVRCMQLALGAEPGQETIYLNKMASTNSFFPGWGKEAVGTETVKLSTVDQVMAEEGIDFIHFLKIDTEGFELEVLKGAQEALASSRVAIILVELGIDPRVSPHTSFAEVMEHLAPLGYYLHGIYNQTRSAARVRTPAAWDAGQGGGYTPDLLVYCDAVFVRVDLEPRG